MSLHTSSRPPPARRLNGEQLNGAGDCVADRGQGGRAAGRQRAAGEKSAAPFFFLPFTFVVEADADTDRVLALRETNCLRIMH